MPFFLIESAMAPAACSAERTQAFKCSRVLTDQLRLRRPYRITSRYTQHTQQTSSACDIWCTSARILAGTMMRMNSHCVCSELSAGTQMLLQHRQNFVLDPLSMDPHRSTSPHPCRLLLSQKCFGCRLMEDTSDIQTTLHSNMHACLRVLCGVDEVLVHIPHGPYTLAWAVIRAALDMQLYTASRHDP